MLPPIISGELSKTVFKTFLAQLGLILEGEGVEGHPMPPHTHRKWSKIRPTKIGLNEIQTSDIRTDSVLKDLRKIEIDVILFLETSSPPSTSLVCTVVSCTPAYSTLSAGARNRGPSNTR